MAIRIAFQTNNYRYRTFLHFDKICVISNKFKKQKFSFRLYLHNDMDLRNMRTPYHDRSKTFNVEDLKSKEPIGQFQHWFEEMCKTGKVVEPNAVCLSTCTNSGLPSSRMVLMKGFGNDGFKFFTNYLSRKGFEIKENPNVALLFYWEHEKRQVRIEGKIVNLPKEESDEYFNSRPRASQMAASVSPQSQIIVKKDLDAKMEVMRSQYEDPNQVIPRPNNWGGFRVIPEQVEFWQGQSDRFHDRLRFRKLKSGENPDNIKLFEGTDGWVIERLAP